jgi:outer membrane protein, multidrug efflux system
MEVQRQQYEHALAVLLGKPAAEFSLADEPLRSSPPVIPTGVPSELLERRPDIAQAERTMAAQNANIGVARAAFFPAITLTGSGGYNSSSVASLVNLPNLTWSLGAAAVQPIFEGGRLKANLAVARAAYDQAVANYRQQVLMAFQEVEDGLSGLRVLEQQEAAQQQAIQSARKTLDISTARYKQGLANYLEVIDAQRAVLDNEETSAQTGGLRLITSVQLIKALGGGWQDSPIH